MKRVLILHGTEATPESHWFSWLKQELTAKGYQVWLPQLPGADKPNMERYVHFLLGNNDFSFDEETLLVGHSSGAVAILGLLQHLPEGVKVGKCILVSAFIDDLGWDVLVELFEQPFDFAKIKTHCDDFVLLHSDNDPYVPLRHAEYLAEHLGGKLIVKPGEGHFNLEASPDYKEFPELLELID